MADLSRERRSQEKPSSRDCGLRAALDIVEGKWKPLILWYLLAGARRYGSLRRELGEVSEKVFLAQLRQLEADGIVRRTLVSEQPLAVEYALTPLGETLVPLLVRISQWGFDNVIDPAMTASRSVADDASADQRHPPAPAGRVRSSR